VPATPTLPVNDVGPRVVGTSAATRLRNNGVPVEPFGEARIKLGDSDANVTAMEPEPETGLLETLNMFGMVSPTEVTVPATACSRYEYRIPLTGVTCTMTAPGDTHNDTFPY